MKTALLNSLGKDVCKQTKNWTTTAQTRLKLCHQLGAITGLWTREPITTAFIGMPGTTKNELNNVREDFNAAWKTKKVSHMCLAEHTMIRRDRYEGIILDTRFEVTRNTLILGSFDVLRNGIRSI